MCAREIRFWCCRGVGEAFSLGKGEVESWRLEARLLEVEGLEVGVWRVGGVIVFPGFAA